MISSLTNVIDSVANSVTADIQLLKVNEDALATIS